jgi:hypothetical protein
MAAASSIRVNVQPTQRAGSAGSAKRASPQARAPVATTGRAIPMNHCSCSGCPLTQRLTPQSAINEANSAGSSTIAIDSTLWPKTIQSPACAAASTSAVTLDTMIVRSATPRLQQSGMIGAGAPSDWRRVRGASTPV